MNYKKINQTAGRLLLQCFFSENMKDIQAAIREGSEKYDYTKIVYLNLILTEKSRRFKERSESKAEKQRNPRYIFEEDELGETSVVRKFRTTASEFFL